MVTTKLTDDEASLQLSLPCIVNYKQTLPSGWGVLESQAMASLKFERFTLAFSRVDMDKQFLHTRCPDSLFFDRGMQTVHLREAISACAATWFA